MKKSLKFKNKRLSQGEMEWETKQDKKQTHGRVKTWYITDVTSKIME